MKQMRLLFIDSLKTIVMIKIISKNFQYAVVSKTVIC